MRFRYVQRAGKLVRMSDEQIERDILDNMTPESWAKMLDDDARRYAGTFRIRVRAINRSRVQEGLMNQALADGYDPIGAHYGVNL